MYAPLEHDDRFIFVRAGHGDRGTHVLPGDLMDRLPEWPLASNRPAGRGDEPARKGMLDAVYETRAEADAALKVALAGG